VHEGGRSQVQPGAGYDAALDSDVVEGRFDLQQTPSVVPPGAARYPLLRARHRAQKWLRRRFVTASPEALNEWLGRESGTGPIHVDGSFGGTEVRSLVPTPGALDWEGPR
jgi:hypothetical protein